MGNGFFGNQAFPRDWAATHNKSIVTTGNAIAATLSISQTLASLFGQTASAINDAWKAYPFLERGVYHLRFTGEKTASSGILTVGLDGSTIGTIDWYNVAPVFNSVQSILSLSVATSGNHTLTGLMATKNGASAGFDCLLTMYAFEYVSA